MPSVQCKAKAAIEYCKKQGWEYKFIDPKLDEKVIMREYKSGNIKFGESTQKKFEEYYKIIQ